MKSESLKKLLEIAEELGWNIAVSPPLDADEGVHGVVLGTIEEIEFMNPWQGDYEVWEFPESTEEEIIH